MDGYVKVYDWMLGLGLKPGEILAFAIIYSFGKDGEWFQGSASYLGARIGVKDRDTVFKYLSSLVGKGLLERRERWEKGQHLCDYRPTEKIGRACPQNRHGAYPKNGLHNSRPDKNRDNLKEIKNKEIGRMSLDDFSKTLK